VTGTGVRKQALEPLTATLLARARADADGERTTARQEGQRAVEAARDQADAVLAQARALGEADAAAMLAAERARARSAARGEVLAAQRAAFDELRDQARTAVAGLLADPVSRGRLAASMRTRLGDGATVRDHPAGGVVAESPDGRRIDACLDALLDAALAELDLEQLWTAP
jgi:vacuolar-type H+-ATPase subunit E/Vma4